MNLWFSERWTNDTKFSIRYEEKIITRRSKYQKIDFYKSNEWGTFFTLDDLLMVTEKDEFIYHDMIVHPAMTTNPNIKNVLVIGGGDGGTVRELTRYSSIEKIHMVEIDKDVVDLCKKYLPQTAKKLDDKRVELFFEDGKKFVKNVKEKYDLIIVDSTDPISIGEGLFTLDFYKDCYNALSSEGILINQHESPYFDSYSNEMKKAHLKLKEVFEISKVYQFHQAVYPSGHWLFGFASKKYDPIKDIKKDEWNKFNINTKYYNTNIHIGSFMLPTYVLNMLNK